MPSNDTIIHASPVAEGVRIQIGSATAFAVRRESKDISLRIRREYHTARDAMARIPFLRGIVRLVCGVTDFLDGVAESAQLDPQQIVKGSRFEQRFAELFRINPTAMVASGSALMILIMLVGLVLVGPWALVRYALPALELELPRPAINAIACAARVLGGLLCVAVIPRLRVVSRLCMYRGAINKVLDAAGERGQVTRESAEKGSRLSCRSDAAFTVTVLLLSIVAFALVRTFTLPVQLLVRVLIVLIIAAVANEPIRLLENACPKPVAAALLAPQRLLERLMVREPHVQMLEVAVCAYRAARENDR